MLGKTARGGYLGRGYARRGFDKGDKEKYCIFMSGYGMITKKVWGKIMQIFDIIVGLSSIGSLIVSIIALFKVSSIKQSINKSEIISSKVVLSGRDYNGE